MKLVFVHPAYSPKNFSENFSVVDEEFCHAPPLILAYVAAIAEQAGHEVRLIDAYAENLDKEEVLSRIFSFSPDFIAMRLETYHFHTATEWIDHFKKNLPHVKVIVGGVNCVLYPEESLACSGIDYMFSGDVLESLPAFLEGYDQGADGYARIPGLSYRSGSVWVRNELRPARVAFDKYPFPARHLLKNNKYFSFLSQKKNFTIMVTSRGCPFKCSFCAISAIPYEERSVASVIKEIEVCYHELGVREIDFFDAVLFYNRKRIIEICREIRRRGLRIEWSCRCRVDRVDDELLSEAYQAGCRRIYYGVESASPDILREFDKGISVDQVRNAIQLSRKNRIRTMGFFMIGGPGETKETVMNTIAFSQKLGLDFAQFCKVIAKPNTRLNIALTQKRGDDFWSERLRQGDKAGLMERPWTELTSVEIDNFTRQAYFRFYFRPEIIFRVMMHTRSFSELMRYAKVAVKMVLRHGKGK